MSDSRGPQRDYRIQALSALAKDFTSPNTGQSYKAGTPVLLVGLARYDKMRVLTFPLPNMTALFLDQAHVAWTASQTLLQEERFLNDTSKHMPAGTIFPKDEASFFELFEQRMVAIVFAFTALESFANESIPEDHVFNLKRDDGKCTEVYTKDQTERLSLDIKLSQVLPPIFGVTTPKGGQVWNKYIRIKKLRDRIIHLKSKDRGSSQPDDDTIWRELINKFHPNIALDAKEIIGYFLKKSQDKPPWFTLLV